MEYKLTYSNETGNVNGITWTNSNGSVSFCGINTDNTDFQQFEIWNAEQDPPLDLDSTIPVPVNYSISPDQIVIPADGETSALLTVVSDPEDATAELLYGGLPLSVPLVDGRGTYPVTSTITGVLVITGASGGLADCVTYVYAGIEVNNG